MSAGINTSRETTSGLDCSILVLAFWLFIAGLFLIKLESKRRSAAFDGIDSAYITKGRQRELAEAERQEAKRKHYVVSPRIEPNADADEAQPIGVSRQYFGGIESYSSGVTAFSYPSAVFYKNKNGDVLQMCISSGGKTTCINQ